MLKTSLLCKSLCENTCLNVILSAAKNLVYKSNSLILNRFFTSFRMTLILYFVTNFRLLVIGTIVVITAISCVSHSYTITKDKKNRTVVVGSLSWDDWTDVCGWIDCQASGYLPSDFNVKIISELASPDSVRFIVFAGSWCEDSESEVPKIFKLFKAAAVPSSKATLYGVDSNKREPSGMAEFYRIQRVPTLIIMKGSRQAARIVEYPEKSWEEDIIKYLF